MKLISELSRSLLVCLAIGSVLGCTSQGDEALEVWMREQKDALKPKVEPISEPKNFIPQAYESVTLTDPFNSRKLTELFKPDQNQPVANSTLIAPEMARRPEPLEAYPLDSMTMVGVLKRAGKMVALVKLDKLLYQVAVGEHLGQNYGKITDISEAEMKLREIVQDATGEWTERTTVLQLQEGQK
jgi:type IV pilus assembly protein PilP